MAASPLPLLLPAPLPLPALTFPPRRAARRILLQPPRAGRTRLRDPPPAPPSPVEEEVAEEEDDDAPPLRLLEPPQEEDPFPAEMEPADPDFYRIGYVRMMRAYGIEFLEGPDGMAVYASRDVEPLRRARVIMEIPLELMLTITQKRPWMFFPDIIPLGHPIFDIIESTDPESSTRKRDMKKLVQDHSPCQPLALQSDPDITILPIKEIERRRKIGAANKGKVPWTNGRKLSKEHKALIKQRTTEALRDPKVMSC